jgi:gliding motility-associated-like protein
VVTLHLTVNLPTAWDTTVAACENFLWKGVTYTESGNYTTHETSAHGCDSMVTLHLTVNHPTSWDTSVVACENFTWEGETYTQSGNYTSYRTNAHGCDSVVTLHLTVNQPTAWDTSAVACDNYTWEDETYTQSGVYSFHKTNAAGCDSVVTLHLTVNKPTAWDTSVVACDDYTWEGETYTQSGDYTTYKTNAAGCDSLVTLHLTVIDTALSILSLTEDFCESMSAELVAVTEMTDYLWSTGEQMPNITVTQPGYYSVTAMQGDCRATAHYTVSVCDFQFVLPNAISPSKSDGLNDELTLPERMQNMFNTFEISIFDRWGELVFYSTDKGFSWRGEIDGRISVNTVYNYIIRCTDMKGKPYRFTGSITVL